MADSIVREKEDWAWYVCPCGWQTQNKERFDRHVKEYPKHWERI